MWDNRATKRNPKAPDYKCRDRSCDGVIWPPKAVTNGASSGGKRGAQPKEARNMGADLPGEYNDDDAALASAASDIDNIPF